MIDIPYEYLNKNVVLYFLFLIMYNLASVCVNLSGVNSINLRITENSSVIRHLIKRSYILRNAGGYRSKNLSFWVKLKCENIHCKT